MDDKRKFDGVIFDMDGTLIDSGLDFSAIRSELGIGSGVGVIEAIEQMPAPSRARAEAKLLAHELAGAGRATLLPGVAAVLDTCRALGMKAALLTRNTRRAVDIAMERFEDLRFDLIRCREDGIVKPEPDGVLIACEAMGVEPQRTVSLGDFHFDIIAANAAGLTSVLLTTSKNWRDFAHEANHVIDKLEDFLTIIA